MAYRSPGNIAILYDTLDILQLSETNKEKVELPKSPIKMAYSMTEADTLYPEWVALINEQFEAVVVPDPF